MLNRTLVVVLLLVSPCLAQPVPRIDGPTSGTPGDIIFLDASKSTADHFDWLIDSSGVSLPSKSALTHVVVDGGKKVLLASYPGTWRISLAVGDKNGVKQLQWKIVVAGGTPGPDPPPPTDDKFDLSDEAREWLKSVPAAYRTPARDISETLNEIGARWKEAGSIKAMETLVTFGVGVSLAPLGANASKWGEFFAAANLSLDKLKTGGATAEQYGKALQSIAKGMK